MLKRIFSVCVLLAVGHFASAQMDEGYFQFSIDVEAIDTSEEVRAQANLLRASRMEMYFAPGLYRMDYHLGKMSSTSIRVDTFQNLALSITSGIMGNYAYQDKPEALGFGQLQSDSLFTVQHFDEYKTIMGIKCKKAVLEREGIRSTYWCTKEFNVKADGLQLINKDVPGFPMAFTTIQGGVRIHYQVSNYKDYIANKAEVFSVVPPAEYKVMPSGTEQEIGPKNKP